MNNKLITTLRQAAKALEDGTFAYDWTKMSSCNCGVIASCVMKIGTRGLQNLVETTIPSGRWTWTRFVGEFCPVTGLPEHVILKALTEAGLTPKDIVDLEYLRGESIVRYAQAHGATFQGRKEVQKYGPFNMRKRETTTNFMDYENKRNLIAYLRGWADMLVEQGRDDVVETTEAAPKSQVLVHQAV